MVWPITRGESYVDEKHKSTERWHLPTLDKIAVAKSRFHSLTGSRLRNSLRPARQLTGRILQHIAFSARLQHARGCAVQLHFYLVFLFQRVVVLLQNRDYLGFGELCGNRL